MIVFPFPVEHPGTDAQEGNPVPVSLIHVRLNFKYKGGESLRNGIHRTPAGSPGKRRHRHPEKAFKERLDAEVIQGGTEENRGKPSCAHLLQGKFGTGTVE